MTDAHSRVEDTYRQERDRLWRSLVAFTGDPEVASDSLAEAFAQLLGRGDEVREPASWVWTAAFRIASGELRKRRRAPPSTPAAPYVMPDPVDHLVQALASLPRGQRLAVVLHDYADRPTDEVAWVLGVTKATVHVHLSRGRKRLRRLLKDETDE